MFVIYLMYSRIVIKIYKCIIGCKLLCFYPYQLQKNCVDETSSQDVLTKDAASSNETKDRLQGSPSHESNPEELSSSGESGKADLMKAIQEMEESQDAETGRGNKEQELGGMNKEQETTSCGQGSTEVDRSSFLCFRNNYFEV